MTARDQLIPKRLLIVDDEGPMLTAMLIVLRLYGFQAEGERTVASALARFAAEDWDVVLTDLAMPGRNGEELAAEIKQLNPRMPIVLMTGMSKVTVKSPELFDAILNKPFTPGEMLSCLEKVIRKL